MRAGLVVVGIILLILGAVLWFVPLIPSSDNFSASTPDCPTAPDCTFAYNIYTASSLVPTYAKLSWSSPETVTFVAFTCTNSVSSDQLDSANTSAELRAVCGTNATVGNTTGTSGSYSFTIPAGGSLVFLALTGSSTPPNVTSTLTGTEPFLGLILVVLGVIVLILGLVLKSRRQKAAANPALAPITLP